MKNWLEVYLSNYHGQSPEAKELEAFMKPNYKGNQYIPWATMERLTYQQDPEAVFYTMLVSEDNSGIVHTDKISIETTKGAEFIQSTAFSHFVRVEATFLGKSVIEDYPIQDEKYEAPKVFDQNLVNKALKRAMAKVASRVTGLGLKLYENGDLQFDTPAQGGVKKPIVQKTEEALKSMAEPVAEVKPEVKVQVPAQAESNDYILNIVSLLKSKDAELVRKVLKNFNPSLLKSYGFELSPDDDEAVMGENLIKVPNPEKMYTALERLLK